MFETLKLEILLALEKAILDRFGEVALPPLVLGLPPRVELGDLTFGAFPLAKVLRKSPALIAKELAESLEHPALRQVQAAGPYLNMTLAPPTLFKALVESICEVNLPYGFSTEHQGKRVMVEFSSPNTNKPLHIGHVRNIVLGWSVSRILEAVGYEVVKACLVNDRGVHICKSMLAYQRFFQGQTPASRCQKGDHLIGDCYVAFENALKEEKAALRPGFEAQGLKEKALEEAIDAASPLQQEVREMLRKWEAGDPKILALWKQLNDWVYEGFDSTYETLGVSFDNIYHESDLYLRGRTIVHNALEQGHVFRHEDGSVRVDLSEEGLDSKVLLRSDGTSLYITQDIGLAVQKWEDYKLDRSVYVIGNEQDHQMRTLFSTLKKMGYTWAEGLYHLSYGMVFLPEGRMKSREGKVVDADDLIAEMFEKARAKALEALAQDPRRSADELSVEELDRRARAVGLGAIKHYMLKVNPRKDFTFNPDESIQLTGDTGPYVQYTHARIKSILRKAVEEGVSVGDVASAGGYQALGNEDERGLARLLIDFPNVVEEAARTLMPSTIAKYLCDLAATFNRFYHNHSVLGAKTPAQRGGRLALSEATSKVLASGLDLLGIEAPEAM